MSSQQQSDATPSMAKNDTPSPSYDPRLTKSISVSSHKLLDECKTSGEELLGDAETVDGGECTVTEHSQGLPRRLIPPEKEAGVPKFGSWGELDPSSDDGFTSIFNKVRDSRRAGIETSGGDDSEPEKAAGVPKFGSWGELDPSSDDGFTSIFHKVKDSNRTGIETSGGDDSEPPPPRRGTTHSGNCSNECIQGGQDAPDSCYEFTTGNQKSNLF